MILLHGVGLGLLPYLEVLCMLAETGETKCLAGQRKQSSAAVMHECSCWSTQRCGLWVRLCAPGCCFAQLQAQLMCKHLLKELVFDAMRVLGLLARLHNVL